MIWLDAFSPGKFRVPATALAGLALGLALGVTGCSSIGQRARSVASSLTPYKAEVVQGNFVSREQVAQLHAGMTRVQARDLLGTPLITPLFEGDRWDYVFTMRRQGVPPQHYRLTLYFSGDALDRFDGDEMPSEDEFVQRISGHTRKDKVPPLQATPEQLKRFAADNPASAASAPDAAASAPDKTYPPLE
ncbi:MAG: outer membrane protein assembly factor BamE [Burkholderiaceae bacterium]|jgi:outer membrane protein assembly factor BamE|nr:outer membrane protein assembly factor BamE [Burkholderiaceae bacterium]